jgi:TonB-linked SusC/RagA family outer membrane protein
MKKLTFVLLSLVLGVSMAVAQSKQITGTVISAEDGEPIIGASVVVKGTTTGTVTDLDGNFDLSIPTSAKTIVFSYIGMKTQDENVKSNMKITMHPDTKLLDEVVVTGYGTFKKSSFTGAASSVSTENVKDIPSLSVQDRLAGAVSGVQITSTSGQPGAVASVRIRGMGSINADKNPLYVIDGIPMLSGNMSGFDYADSGNSMLSTLNSNDIESMTVIKDAAAASLYGSRAANGVIVITTKKGVAGKTKVNMKADWGFSDMAIDYRPTLNGEDRRDLLHLGLVNNKLNGGSSLADATAYADSEIDGYAAKPKNGYTDWKDLLFQKGGHQNYEINAQGGSESTKFYTSLAYIKQEGITLQSGYERFTGRANVTHKSGRLTIDAGTMFSNSTQRVNSEGTSFASPIMVISMTASPSTVPYNEDGTYSNNFPALNGANPLQTAHLNYNKSLLNRTLSNISATYNIWDNLNIKETLSYDFTQNNEQVWWDPKSNDGRSSKGVMQRYMINKSKFSSQTQLTYAKTIAENHNIDALLGFETEDYKYDYTYSNGISYPTTLPEIGNAGTTKSSSNNEAYRMTSYLGRLNYDYANKYYASASFRRDGSSRLARDSRWGDFWSISGSWRLSQEKFMEPTADVINNAKIRASYGVNGTQPSDYYQYMGIYAFGYNYNGKPGSSEARPFNNDLRWEKNYATNIGVDLTLFNRFSISADWYNRDTKDLLMNKAISGVVGLPNTSDDDSSTMLQNVGSLRNRGFEVELKSTNIQKKDFMWETTLNISHNKNTLMKLDGDQDEMIDGVLIHKVGQPYYSIYAYEYAGVDPKTGKESYYVNGKDGDRSVTTNSAEANKTTVGSIDPKVQGGLTNYISYKGLDFGFTLTYSLGGSVYDRAGWVQSNGGTYHYFGNIPAHNQIADMWQKEGDIAKLPQFVEGNTNTLSSRWLLSTNHLRLKNMTIGYSLPNNLASKLGLSKVRAYMSGNNLLTFKSKDLYVDPEAPSNGLTTFETPSLKTLTFGIEIGF